MYPGPTTIPTALPDLTHATGLWGGFEVIVVDNASCTRETAKVVALTPFRYVREEQTGVVWARDRGAAEASHDIIAYVDDDVRVDPGWLGGIARAFTAPEVTAVTGLVLPAELETRAQHLFEIYGGMSKGFKAKRFEGTRMSPHSLIAMHLIGVGANMAFRRKTLIELGGFDTALGVEGGEDLDMFHRVLVAGGIMRYEPSALVWRQHRRDMVSLRQQLYNSNRSYGIYLIKLWRNAQVGRAQVASYALWRWGRWLVGRLVLGLLRRHRLPIQLLWAELWGALHSPWIYFATYRHDRRVRKKLGLVPGGNRTDQRVDNENTFSR